MVTRFVTASAKGSTKESYSTARSAAEEAMKKLGKRPDLVILYCDASYDVKEALKGVREATDKAPLTGCTSYGEFTEEGAPYPWRSYHQMTSDSFLPL